MTWFTRIKEGITTETREKKEVPEGLLVFARIRFSKVNHRVRTSAYFVYVGSTNVCIAVCSSSLHSYSASTGILNPVRVGTGRVVLNLCRNVMRVGDAYATATRI